MSSTLIAHNGTMKCSMDDLKALPDPQPLGRCHRPMRHDHFVEELTAALAAQDYQVKRSEFSIGAKGAKLFGVMDLFTDRSSVLDPLHRVEGVGMAVGLRHSNDKSLGYRIVCGGRIMVCDNLAMQGETNILSCKHTANVVIKERLVESVQHLIESYGVLDENLVRLSNSDIVDDHAKKILYDAFLQDDVMALKYLRDVGEWYFNPPDEATDCQPRTLWGLHNAFTRTIKSMESVAAQYQASNAVGRYFGLSLQA